MKIVLKHSLTHLLGYWQDTPPPKTIPKDLIAAVQTAGTYTFYKKVESKPTCLYSILVFKGPKDYMVLLLHDHYPVVARVEAPSQRIQENLAKKIFFQYLDVPAEVTAVLEEAYQVLPQAYLEGAITPDILTEFDKKTLKIINHFQPEKIGDMIFNYWD